ncbi:hypothetical protein TCON_1459 [Astathelohania contejeani]|uniref:Uncharacterized protein n=1 Tax=Astathelohania contejeani TaxID=164912 RepID=A0ABQ7HYZ0_9MICR|nr:hypothetical protein TCON_1459 [Thelohania contejeani]
MVLIIESFEVPAQRISNYFFPGQEIKLMDDISDCYTALNKKILYVNNLNSNLEKLKYYSNEIFEVVSDDLLLHINKKKHFINNYKILRNVDGMVFGFEKKNEERADKDECNEIDKTEYLPYLKAQNDEIVYFPNEEDD